MADLNKVGFSEGCKEMFIDFGQICRFCLMDTKSGLNINGTCLYGDSKELEGETICSFMMKLGLIKMEDPKTFPTQVCKNCYQLIQVCYDFYQASQKSSNILRDCLNHSKEEFKKIILNSEKEENEQSVSSNILKNEKQNELLIIPSNKNLISTQTMNSHSNQKPNYELISYSCTQCSLKFNNSGALKLHYAATHIQKRCKTSIKVQCKTCTKVFSSQERLKRHYKIVHKATEKSALDDTVQQVIQTEEKKFFCFHCIPCKEFLTEEHLTEHLTTSHINESSKMKAYTCMYCNNSTFHTKLKLNEHLLLVHNWKQDDVMLKDVECQIPLKETKPLKDVHSTDVKSSNYQISELLEVMTGVAQEGKSFKILCQKCTPPAEFTSVNDFAQHVQNHQIDRNNGGWNCPQCPAAYSRKQTLQLHMKEKHKESSLGGLKCPESDCLESFASNRQLILHGITVHQKYFAYFHKAFRKIADPEPEDEDTDDRIFGLKRVKNFECDVCQKKYFYKSSLRKHIQAAHLGKPNDSVDCPHCGKTISSKLNLKSHIEFVHEALFVSCPICKKKINFRAIGKHYKTHKTTQQLILSKNSFLCNLCGKILKSKRSFQDHQKLHWNIRDEICDICGHGFTTKKFLLLHKKIHEGGIQRKAHRCDQCEKVFSGKHTLNRHLLTHSGKKNFICEICSKCFYTLQELNRHVRYHKKEYRFDCQLCDMRFLDKSRFRHHMMRHRNVRPHKCQFCDKMFIVRGKMNLHMATKHNFQVEDKKGIWKDPKTYVPLDDLL